MISLFFVDDILDFWLLMMMQLGAREGALGSLRALSQLLTYQLPSALGRKGHEFIYLDVLHFFPH